MLLPRLTFGEGEGFLNDFGDTAVAGFGVAVVEDGEEIAAAARGGHALPASEGVGIACESGFQDRGEFAFGFHGREQLLGDLLGAAFAGFSALWLSDPVGQPFADGVAQFVEPAKERAVF